MWFNINHNVEQMNKWGEAKTHFIRLYTSSSAISLPNLLYVVSTNTRTFESIFNLASVRWSWLDGASDGDLFNVWHRIIGIGFVSRWMRLVWNERKEKKNIDFLFIFDFHAIRHHKVIKCLSFHLIIEWFSIVFLCFCEFQSHSIASSLKDSMKWNVLYLMIWANVCCCFNVCSLKKFLLLDFETFESENSSEINQSAKL